MGLDSGFAASRRPGMTVLMQLRRHKRVHARL
jgi:hypothetical protein